MKKFELLFHMGPNTSQSERVYVNAETIEEAEKMAYQMPQAKQYRNLMVGEFKEGESGYMVAFNYYRHSHGKKDYHRFESRIPLKATSIEQAKRHFMKKYYGKYQNGVYDFKQDIPLENNLNSEKSCSIEICQPFEVFQFATNKEYYSKYEDATNS